MTPGTRWRYRVAVCRFKEGKPAGLFSGDAIPSEWVLVLEREYALEEGLGHMGSMGWELAGIQPSLVRTGDIDRAYAPESIYVFKQPAGT